MRKALVFIGLIFSCVFCSLPALAQLGDGDAQAALDQTVAAEATAALAAELPEGVTFENATPGQLNRALKKVARKNPKDVALLKAATKNVVDTGKVSNRRATTTVTRVAVRSLSRTPSPTPTSTSSAAEIDVIVEVTRELIASQNLSQTEITQLVLNVIDTIDASRASDDQVNEVAQGLGVVLREEAPEFAAGIIEDINNDLGTMITSKSGTTATASLL